MAETTVQERGTWIASTYITGIDNIYGTRHPFQA